MSKNTPKQRTKRINERFWSFVKRGSVDECWLWQGTGNQKGYGHFCFKGNTRRAHRVSWRINNGPIPKGLQVLHRCDNPACVNPKHLFLGTNDDNWRDKIKKNRQSKLKGMDNPSSKLSRQDVKKIRRLSKDGMSMRDIASRFDITYGHVAKIVRRDLWKHVP